MIPYGRHLIDKRDIRAVIDVLKSDWLTQGPKPALFEKAFARYCGAKYAVSVSSGTAALHLACLAAGLKPGDEAVTSPLTFLASANAALYCGARVRFADVERDTLNIDSAALEKKINARTRVLIPVHLAGLPCDMRRIGRLAKKRGAAVIEDACHALGSRDGAGHIGNCRHSDMAAFSFHPVKSITTGEGGMVTTNRADLYQKLLDLRNHGMVRDRRRLGRFEGAWFYEMQELGFNYRLTDIQAALGLSQLQKLPSFLRKRKKIDSFYRKELGAMKEIELPVSDGGSANHLFLLRLNLDRIRRSRREVFEALHGAGIRVQVHYIPVHLQPYYRRLGFKKGDCPVAEAEYRRLISLPIYPLLKSAEARYVVSMLKKILKETA